MISATKRLKMELSGENASSLVDDNNNPSNSGYGGESIDDNLSHKTSSCPSVPSGRPPSPGVKYQLRPRPYKSRYLYDPDWSLPDPVGHKSRPPPLSRYRRKTANARERCRMRQINTAFESLRGVLPSWVCRRRAAADMTKIATLKLASAYIRSLQDMLDGNAPQDTCAWVLSGILEEDSRPKEPQDVHSHPGSLPSKAQQAPQPYQPQDPDLVTLPVAPPTPGLFQDNLESFPYLAPPADTDTLNLILGCDAPRPWQQQHQQHAALAT